MMGKLILRHEILRGLPKLLAIAAVTSALVIQVAMFKIARSQGEWTPGVDGLFLLQAVVLASAAAVFFVPSAGNRSRPWEQALPLAASQLWRAYLAALMLGALMVLAGLGAILGLIQVLMANLTRGGIPVFAPLDDLLLRPSAVLFLGACLIAAWHPGLASLHDHSTWTPYRWLLGAGQLALLWVLTRLPVGFCLVPVAVGLMLVVLAARRVPPTLTSAVERGSVEVTSAGLAASLGRIRPAPRAVNYLLLRQLFKWPLSFPIMLPMSALVGVMTGGYNPIGGSDTDLRLFNFFIIVYLLFAATGHLIEKLHMVDHLPIGRRAILLWLVLPQSFALMTGYGAGRWLESRKSVGEIIVLDESDDGYGLKLPPEYFRLASSGKDLAITAPWGERHAAFAVPVWRGLPFRLWKPYTTPPGASRDFVAWQLSRAVQAVYGVEMTPAEAAAYLEVGPDGRTTARQGSLTLAADHPTWRPRSGGPVFIVLVGCELLVWFLVLAFYFRLCGPGITVKRARTYFWCFMMGLMGLHIMVFMSFFKDWTDGWIITGAFLSMIRTLGQEGMVGGFVTGLATVLILFGAWRLVDRSFAHVEAPRS